MAESPPINESAPGTPEADDASVDGNASVQTETHVARWRRWLAWGLVVLGTLFLLVSSFNVWVSRQALETDAWVDASGEFLADETIRASLATWMVDELYSNVDLGSNLEQAASEAAPDGGPIADVLVPLVGAAGPLIEGALRDATVSVADRLLASSEVQELWKEANRLAHTALVAVIDDEQVDGIEVVDGDVVLDLQPVIMELGDRIGVDTDRIDAPEGFGQITVLRDTNLESVQTVVKAIRIMSTVLTLIVLGIFGLAIFIAKGQRRRIVMACASSLLLVGVVLLLVRTIAGAALVDALTSNEADLEPVSLAWGIATQLLANIATALLVYGAVLLIGALLAGPSRAAVAIRRWLAPTFRHRPLVVYAAAIFLILLALLWSPTGQTRELIGSLVLAALLLLGIAAFRRQTLREFPVSDDEPPQQPIAA
jgi:hypothetical protein